MRRSHSRPRRPQSNLHSQKLRSKRSLYLEVLETRTVPSGNPIVTENLLPGIPQSVWDITGSEDATLQGFATKMSVTPGQTIDFKINDVALASYHVDIYRSGFYGGNGARRVATIPSTSTLRQHQPNPLTDATTGLVDAGNWSVSASWNVPATAVSGVYFAQMVREDTGGASNAIFVVRDDASHSDILYQTSDTTWQAYNAWGGSDFYTGSPAGRSYKVSYNRPLVPTTQNQYFNAEYPMVYWLEENGYDVSYFSGVDTDRFGGELLQHHVFLTSGHDEYVSGAQLSNEVAARDAGVSMAFFSGNNDYWKTRWESSLDSSGTTYRTLVCYKETWANAKIDPLPNVWTGTWRDNRFSPPADGGIPENALVGTMFTVQDINASLQVPYAYSRLRLWRDTSVATLAPGATATLGVDTLGYEWNEDVDNGFRPAGLIDLSSTTVDVPARLEDFGNTLTSGPSTHNITLYRAASGALVFSTGTVQWSWGLFGNHDGEITVEDPAMQQATVNIFADMGVQPGSLQPGLVQESASTDTTGPTASITSPNAGFTAQTGSPVTISGTATDAGGGVVAGVEVSTDGGQTWHPASGTSNWTYTWYPNTLSSAVLLCRATDDSGNIGSTSSPVSVGLTGPISLWAKSIAPQIASENDANAVEVGLRFQSDVNGFISGIRFYKGLQNTGVHVGNLWDSNGHLLATGTFTNETASGWQTLAFAAPVAISANASYTASYHTNTGFYSADPGYFLNKGVTNATLHALSDAFGANGVFVYGASAFPTATTGANYWVDVLFSSNAPPAVTATTPSAGATNVNPSLPITATFNEDIQANGLSFVLRDSSNAVVPAAVSYSSATHTASLQPTSPLSLAGTYTANITQAVDLFGNVLTAPVIWQFSTIAQRPGELSLWNLLAVPAVASVNDPNPIELGIRFRTDIDGQISGIRFYKGTQNTGVHTGSLWTSDGQLLATATFANESSTGWQEVRFTSPVSVVAGTTYVASYHTDAGDYAADAGYFSNGGLDNGPLHALANAAGGNGVFLYGSGGFPNQSGGGTNYWVDAILTNTTPPQITGQTPAPGATGVQTNSAITISFDKSMMPQSFVFSLQESSNGPVAGTSSYSDATHTFTFQPNGILLPGGSYTATLTTANDVFGNAISQPVSWSFMVFGTPAISLWNSATTPSVTSFNDSTAVEVGVKIEADVDGYISGVRFYKGSQNTGTHVGSLWTSTGQLLASATFASESSAGWQQVIFSTPVAVAAGSIYVASYHTSTGHYSVDTGYFTSGGSSNGFLHALANGVNGGNGVFAYGPGGFPSQSGNGANYWVDVLFTVDTSPPTVINQTPPAGQTNVEPNSSITAVFSRSIQPGTIVFTLQDSSNQTVPANLSYDNATHTATLQPVNLLALGGSFTATIGTATDLAGNVLAAPVTWSFQVTTQPHYSIWSPNITPAVASFNDPGGVEVGVKFQSDVDGFISGIRFYKGSLNVGPHVGNLWSISGQLLASAAFTIESASGWQQVNFASPVPITANTVYVASYHTSSGYYSASPAYFASSGVDSGYLHVLSSAAGGGNGVYQYTTGGFPSLSYNATNYWVDIAFAVSSTPPTIISQSPSPNQVNVDPAATVTVGFSKSVSAESLGISLTGPGGQAVATTLQYDAQSHVATLQPTAALALGAQYTVTVSSASDLAGNSLVGPVSWSFTTISSVVPHASLWNSLTTPSNAASVDANPIEVGTKFRSDMDGVITAIRFYKGTGNGGIHVGNLWSSTGQLLASAVFSNESNTGWQQVTLSTPVPISANTIYIASYHTNSGHYAFDSQYFSGTGVDSGPLHAPANDAVGGNGVYLYGFGGFPTQSTAGTNYWVDVVFSDPTPVAVVGRGPTPGATNMDPGTSVTVALNKPIQTGSIGFNLVDSGNVSVPATVSYDSVTHVITLQPQAPLSLDTTYTATLSAANDLVGNALPSPVSWSFTTATQAVARLSIWDASATPAVASANDTRAIEVGTKFSTDVSGYITGIRFYKGASNTGTHIGNLWTSSGQLLATANFHSESGSGWQQVNFGTPVAISANTIYVASYHTDTGGYSVDSNFFASGGVDNGPLHALSNQASGGNGVFRYGPSALPDQSVSGNNYWVDVVFTQTSPPLFNEPTQPVSLQIAGPTSGPVAGTVQSYTVTVLNGDTSVATSYMGTVHFGSTDVAAGLPADYTFTAADAGSHTFSVTFKTAGADSLAVTDTRLPLRGSLGVQVAPNVASLLTISALTSTAVAGSLINGTITALDAFGNTATGYLGTVHFSSTDAQAVLPVDYTFTATDAGVHSFVTTLGTAGINALTVSDTSSTNITLAQGSVTVTPAAAHTLTITSYPPTITAGMTGMLTVVAKDAFGNLATGYQGTVHLASSDPQAVLPADYGYSTGDAGVHLFSFTLKTAGSMTIAASDAIDGTIVGNQASILVTPATAHSFLVSGYPATSTAGVASSVTVTAFDAFGNLATGYQGTIYLTSSDGQAGLPINYTFTPGDAGSHAFGVTLKTAGVQAISALDTIDSTINGIESGIVVSPAATSTLNVLYPPTAVAGTPGNVLVTALDTFGNVTPAYQGNLHFTSTDASARLPADYTFVPGDSGSHSFSITFITAGTQSVTATDSAAPGITGSRTGIVVQPGPTATLVVSGISPTVVAGSASSLTVTARDSYGNVANGYLGTVHFTSTDPQGALPSDYTFSLADAGVHTFGVTLKTAGVQSVTATDAANSLAGTQSAITVTPAAASQFGLIGFPSSITAGVSGTVTVQALDPFGNVATGYGGTVHLTSSDGQATLPADYSYAPTDGGMHAFSITLFTAGSQSITATDTVSSGIAGNQSNIGVTPAAASSLILSGFPSLVTAGVAAGFTVTAKDAFGNVATGYRGTAHFTASAGSASLPADYSFVAGDSGVHSFSATFFTAGSNQSLTASDTGGGLSGTETGITVNPAAASSLILSYPTSLVAGVAGTLTVTAVDAFGNTASGYLGTVQFTSSDGQATLPASYAFVTGDAGVHSFSATLKTAGTQSITAVDTVTSGITGTRGGIAVSSASVTALSIAGFPTQATAGQAGTITVAAQDAFGNTNPGYLGTVHFTSNDGQADLPADYAFTAGDAGVHSFGVTLKTAGARSITATDPATSTITGSQSGITVNAAAASLLVVSGFPSSITAGVAGNLTVRAMDPYGNTATAYQGTVHFTSTDPQAALPADYTYAAGDAGVHTFSITLKTAGSRSITVTDIVTSSVTGTQSGITVNPAAARSFVVAGFPTPTTAGVAGTVTITAQDAFGNTATGYRGAVRFNSSDGQATLPANYTFTATDAGIHNFNVTLKTAGTQSITATDTVSASVTGTQSGITVNPASASNFLVNGFPTPTTAGVAGNVTVRARDAFGNTATSYLGTVHFTSTDTQATLPADYAFTAGDAGVHTFSVTLKTAGTRTISATDTVTSTITGTQTAITVTAAATSVFVVSGFPASITAGVAGNVTVTAKDPYGNTTSAYRGTVHLTSTDSQAVLPADYTYTPTDAGVHAFSVTLKTAGSRALTATDTVTSSITGTQSGITVNPAAASTLVLAGFPTPTTAGVAGTITATARDAFGNTATGYRGAVHFTSSDGQATLPANYAFRATDAGIHNFNVTLKTAGTQSITATDTVSASVTGSQSGITVIPASASNFLVNGFPTSTTAGVAANVTIRARDAFGNTATGYLGTVHFTSTDTQASLPADYAFTAGDGGVHTFSVTLKTAGTRTIRATDTVTSSITGAQTGITVTAAATSVFVVSGFPASITAGVAGNVTVTAKDPYGNTTSAYRGTVHLTSTDSQAVLPADYTYTATDAGVHAFSVTLKTAGSRAITATDTVTSSITGTQSGITVNPAAAASISISAPTSVTAGTAFTFTITILDAFGNTATGYRGTVHFTSSDGRATLPANYTFRAADNGVHTFTATFRTRGTQSLTATDTVTNTITGTQSGISVVSATVEPASPENTSESQLDEQEADNLDLAVNDPIGTRTEVEALGGQAEVWTVGLAEPATSASATLSGRNSLAGRMQNAHAVSRMEQDLVASFFENAQEVEHRPGLVDSALAVVALAFFAPSKHSRRSEKELDSSRNLLPSLPNRQNR